MNLLDLTLPFELVLIIAKELEHDWSALRTFALISQESCIAAQSILYHSFQYSKPATRAHFLTSITEKPHLALYVRIYDTGAIEYAEQPLWDLTKRALPLMTNLKRLYFRLHNDRPVDLSAFDCCSFSLEQLRFWVDEYHSLRLPGLVTSQTSLKIFRFVCEKEIDVPTTALPNLDTLWGGYYLIRGLLPTRTIRHLVWEPEEFDPHPDSQNATLTFEWSQYPMSLLSIPFGQLVSLSVGHGYWSYSRPPLKYIAPYLTSLLMLEIFGLFEDDLLAIASLPKVQHCMIGSGSGRVAPFATREDRLRASQYLYEENKSLILLDLWITSYHFQRWNKGISSLDLLPSLKTGIQNKLSIGSAGDWTEVR